MTIETVSLLISRNCTILCESSSLVTYLTYSSVVILSEIKNSRPCVLLLIRTSCLLKIVLRKNVSGIKNKGWQQSSNCHVNSHGLMLIMLFVWISFARPSKTLTYKTNIFWNSFYSARYIHICKVLPNKHWLTWSL